MSLNDELLGRLDDRIVELETTDPEAEKNRSRYVLADEFDGLLYVDETSRAVPL